MKKIISSDECKSMFSDKFNVLTMKDIGIELKHFSMGTAPEKPSFLVNQEELKEKIIEKFCDFFDEDKSQGLEIIFLKSNYGNGKSHFIRMIYTFLNEYENVFAGKVSLKQEEADLKKKILESISQKKLKECADFLVDAAIEEALSDEKEAVISSITEKYSVDTKLSQIIYEAARSNDITKQVQAIAILKGNYLPAYLKNFDCKKNDLLSGFYYDVIRLVSLYLKEKNLFLVVVFDEYEHVFSWKSDKARKNLYEDIKLFTDNIDAFGNMFFVFAESASVENLTESMDDPAFVSRKANLTYQITDISSENEVDKLFRMILRRYQKYYSVSFEDCMDEIFQLVKKDSLIKTKTNYRGYTQAIMRALDQYRNEPSKYRDYTQAINEPSKENKCSSRLMKWKNATSISRKTMLCESLEKLLEYVGENIVSGSRKRGEYVTKVGDINKKYYVISTDNPNLKSIKMRYKAMLNEKKEEKLYVLYPAIKERMALETGDTLVYYDDDIVDKIFQIVSDDKKTYNNIDAYFDILDVIIL